MIWLGPELALVSKSVNCNTFLSLDISGFQFNESSVIVSFYLCCKIFVFSLAFLCLQIYSRVVLTYMCVSSFLALLALCCCPGSSHGCGEQGLLSSCGGGASLGGGFSPCVAQALGREGSVDVARGLSSCGPQASLTQGLWAPAGSGFGAYMDRRILYHWANREALCIFLWLLVGQKWNFSKIRCVGAKGKCTNIYINSMITGFKIQLYFCLFS